MVRLLYMQMYNLKIIPRVLISHLIFSYLGTSRDSKNIDIPIHNRACFLCMCACVEYMRERISSLFRVFKIWCVIIISYLIPFHVVIYVFQNCTSIVHLVLLFMLYVINIYLWFDHCLLIFRHIWSIF